MRRSRAGFTLVEILVATAISLILVLGVVQIAVYALRAYDSAMSLVSTTAVSRQVLDTLESDIQSAILRNDGGIWLECASDQNPDPSTSSNLDKGACKSLLMFGTPSDRDLYKPGKTGAGREAYKGEVCAVRYRLDNKNPLPAALISDPQADRAFSLYRTLIDPEKTFTDILPKSADANTAKTLYEIWNAYSYNNGVSSRSLKDNASSDIFGMNIVGITPVFVFKKTDSTKTPATSWFFYAYPRSAVNDTFYKDAKNFGEGFGSETAATSFTPLPFDTLQIAAGKYAVDQTGTASKDKNWKDGTLAAVVVSITVVDDVGADLIRATQRRLASGKITPDEEWDKIIREHGRSYLRRINIPGAE